MIIYVPQYGGVVDVHRANISKFTQIFNAIEMPHEFNEDIEKGDLLEVEGPYVHDTILEA